MVFRKYFVSFFILVLISSLFAITGKVSIGLALSESTSEPTPTPQVATESELANAKASWEKSAHADTYDNGQGGNTTCARCKSPKNWDPEAPAAETALNCASCKHIPGEPRPDLPGGVQVPENEWLDIGCEICHQPVGDSYLTSIAFWNNETLSYEPVDDVNELCAHCHKGRHAFEVVEEQAASPEHPGWECTECHGPHGEPSACTDCHDPTKGNGALAHKEHSTVNCTACHDAGQLSIALETDTTSAHYGTYATRRYAHTITSWSSHNLQTAVDCRRCHHRSSDFRPAIAVDVGCNAHGCHDQGAVLNWCPIFPRDPAQEIFSQP